MEHNLLKFDFDDILIEPAVQSGITSRKTVTITDENGMLPLFTAPMDTVVEMEHCNVFRENRIYPMIPRTQTRNFTLGDCLNTGEWVSLSLDQFEKIFLSEQTGRLNSTVRVLIDIANGHMKRLTDAVMHARRKHGDLLVIMVGNVAHPSTFIELSRAGADFVRVGIGNGSGCSTSVHTGIGYPLASLVHDINLEKRNHSFRFAKVVADGGIRKYADIIKVLVLGADYVM